VPCAQAIKEGPAWGGLSEAQQRAVEGELRDFVLGGVALEVRAVHACMREFVKACSAASPWR
jgi:Zn-dependent oligopeptidase